VGVVSRIGRRAVPPIEYGNEVSNRLSYRVSSRFRMSDKLSRSAPVSQADRSTWRRGSRSVSERATGQYGTTASNPGSPPRDAPRARLPAPCNRPTRGSRVPQISPQLICSSLAGHWAGRCPPNLAVGMGVGAAHHLAFILKICTQRSARPARRGCPAHTSTPGGVFHGISAGSGRGAARSR